MHLLCEGVPSIPVILSVHDDDWHPQLVQAIGAVDALRLPGVRRFRVVGVTGARAAAAIAWTT